MSTTVVNKFTLKANRLKLLATTFCHKQFLYYAVYFSNNYTEVEIYLHSFSFRDET